MVTYSCPSEKIQDTRTLIRFQRISTTTELYSFDKKNVKSRFVLQGFCKKLFVAVSVQR